MRIGRAPASVATGRGRRALPVLGPDAGVGGGRHHRSLAALAGWMVVTLTAAAWWAAPQTALASQPGTGIVERGLTPFHSDTLAVDSRARLFYAVDEPVHVTVRQADPPYATTGDPVPLPVSGGIDSLAVDEVHHRLFVAVLPSTTSGADVSEPDQVIVFDGLSRRVIGWVSLVAPTSTSTLAATGISDASLSMAYDAAHDELYAVGTGLAGSPGITNSATQATTVVAVDPERVIDAYSRHAVSTVADWSFPLPQCELPVKSSGGFPGRSGSDVVVPCKGQDASVGSQPEATQGIIHIRLTVDPTTHRETPPSSPAAVSVDTIFGSYGGGGALFDAASGRAVFFGERFGPPVVPVFDVGHRAFVGLIGVEDGANYNSACINEDTGRFYLITDAVPAPGSQDLGLILGEARANEVPYPQGYGFPQYFSLGQVICDPVGHRIFVHGQDQNGEDRWRILEDDVAPYVAPPPPPSPDEETTNTPYRAGHVVLSYSGTGRAYGAQFEQVGGYGGIERDFSLLNAGVSGVAPASPIVTLASSGIPGDPAGVSTSDAQVAAAAQGMTLDPTTRADFTTNGGPDPTAEPESTCSANSEGEAATGSQPGSSVVCDPTKGLATATADPSGMVELPGPVRLAGVSSSVTSQVDKTTGVLTITSWAHVGSLSINDGQVELGDVNAVAVSTSGGLPGTASGSYSRSFGDLVINGTPVCGPPLPTPCDPRTVVEQLNALPQGLVRASLPSPELCPPPVSPKGCGSQSAGDGLTFTLPGTTEGAEANVVRDYWEQRTDEVVNEVTPFDQVVPALRLMVGNDTYRHSYTMISLAEPEAAARLDTHPCPWCSPPPTTTPTTHVTVPKVTIPPTTIPGVVVPLQAAAPAKTKTPPSTAAPSPSPHRGSSPSRPTSGHPAGVQRPATGKSIPIVSLKAGATGHPASKPSTAVGKIASQAAQAAVHLGKGIKTIATSPHRIIELFLIWAVMGLPIYLSSRRQLILRKLVRS